METTRPNPINLTENHLYTNGSNSLTEIGMNLQTIAQDLGYLELSWDGKVKEITSERQAEYVDNIAERFSEVSEALHIPPDFSLMREMLSEYQQIKERRRFSMHPSLALELKELANVG